MGKVTARLSEEEVRERLKACEDPQVVDEIYIFGQMLLKESVQNVRLLDSKASTFAAYGAAIITLLISSSAAWSQHGNRWTLAISILAGFSAFLAAFFAVKTMALRDFEWIGEEEWLETDCFSNIEKLKRYRVLTMWGAMDSHKTAHLAKAVQLRRAQNALKAAVILLLVMLLHLGWVSGLRERFWLTAGNIIKEHLLWMSRRQDLLGSSACHAWLARACYHWLGHAGVVDFRGLPFWSFGLVFHASSLTPFLK